MDKLTEALILERKASKLRLEAMEDKRKAEIESREQFEKRTKVRVYCSSDYAGLENGTYSFYYGYEITVCPTHGNKCTGDCEEYEWAFTAEKDGKEIMRLGTSEVHPEKNEDPMFYLLAGIAHFLKTN